MRKCWARGVGVCFIPKDTSFGGAVENGYYPTQSPGANRHPGAQARLTAQSRRHLGFLPCVCVCVCCSTYSADKVTQPAKSAKQLHRKYQRVLSFLMRTPRHPLFTSWQYLPVAFTSKSFLLLRRLLPQSPHRSLIGPARL